MTMVTVVESLRDQATIHAIEAGYRVDIGGTLRAVPGKFESQPFYAPYFWEGVMNGAETETMYDGPQPIAVFALTPTERAAFDLDAQRVALWEDNFGFIRLVELSDRDYDDLCKRDADSFDQDGFTYES